MNIINPFTGWPFDSFQDYGPNISKLLKRYPITNPLWHVYGEEFITSRLEIESTDTRLLDAWLRPFTDRASDMAQTLDKPDTHIRLFATIQSVPYWFNIYFLKLNSAQINCTVCGSNSTCLECGGTKRKWVYYPAAF